MRTTNPFAGAVREVLIRAAPLKPLVKV